MGAKREFRLLLRGEYKVLELRKQSCAENQENFRSL